MNREPLLEILKSALQAVDGRRCTRETLPDHLPDGAFSLIAVGKAAPAMVRGALDIEAGRLRQGLVIAPRGEVDDALRGDGRLQLCAGGHPLPDTDSLQAGAALLRFVDTVPRGQQMVCLVSGGASSLVEVPRPHIGLEDLRRLNAWLLASGLDIRQVNQVRRRVSTIKDGGLAARMAGHEILALYVSDVPDDEPADIGSGLLRRSAGHGFPSALPGWVRGLVTPADSAPVSLPDVRHVIVANLHQALRGAATAALGLGFAATLHPTRLDGASVAAAESIIRALRQGPAGVHLWGGETTPRLPECPGRGGRNQHLALCCAIGIDGRPDMRILCAATDGRDGATDDAGALVDGGTVTRGRDAGLDPVASLERADSGRFLCASGDLVSTGYTATNVADIVVGMRSGSG